MRVHRIILAAITFASIGFASLAEPQEKVIAVTAKRYEFSPSVIELKLGVPVVLELSSLDRKHGFQIPDLHLEVEIVPGKTTRVRLVPDKAGTFEFHCHIFCGSGHEEMTGQLVVKP